MRKQPYRVMKTEKRKKYLEKQRNRVAQKHGQAEIVESSYFLKCIMIATGILLIIMALFAVFNVTL